MAMGYPGLDDIEEEPVEEVEEDDDKDDEEVSAKRRGGRVYAMPRVAFRSVETAERMNTRRFRKS